MKLQTRQIVLAGLMGALLMVLKEALAPVPGVEPVSLLVILYALCLPAAAPWAIAVFVVLEFILYGFGLWSWMYLYIWFILYGIALLLHRMDSALGWALVSGAYGLAFGALCTPVYFITQGPGGALAWWIAGIPTDIGHCLGNFFTMLLLYRPLRRILTLRQKQNDAPFALGRLRSLGRCKGRMFFFVTNWKGRRRRRNVCKAGCPALLVVWPSPAAAAIAAGVWHGEGRSGCFKTSFTFLFLSFEYTVIIRADYGNLVKEF